MNTKTIKALKASIAHWREMRDDRKSLDGPGSDYCALCALFFRQKNRCVGCPIYKRTEQRFCRGTPYREARVFWLDRLWNGRTWDAWQRAATKEIRFLESLLPKEGRP
jgi:hypothetical protein